MPTYDCNVHPVKIVIIDDDDITLECYSRLLREFHCSLTTYSNPSDSLASLIRQQPQLLFVDMHMPCMDGMELLTTLSNTVNLRTFSSYLCSAVKPSDKIHQQARGIGVDAVCKDMVMDKHWLQNAIQQCRK